MNRFEKIEPSIIKVSQEIDGVISKDRPDAPKALRTFEERRIDWENNGIRKAILIQPTFEVDGVNSDLWNFTLVAWAWIDNKRVSYFEALITKEKFTVIELNITKLLYQGKKTLQDIKLNDLK